MNKLSGAAYSALFIVAASALAACPTGEDLTAGIVFETEAGDIETYRSGPNSTVQIDGVTPDGYTYRTILGQGVHVLQLSDTENGNPLPDTVTNTSYPVAVDALPIPEPSSRWTATTVVNNMGDIFEEVQTQRWGAEITYSVGDCTFRAIPGKVQYASPGFTIDEEIMYLPDLGMSLLVAYSDSESDRDVFTYIEVRAAQ